MHFKGLSAQPEQRWIKDLMQLITYDSLWAKRACQVFTENSLKVTYLSMIFPHLCSEDLAFYYAEQLESTSSKASSHKREGNHQENWSKKRNLIWKDGLGIPPTTFCFFSIPHHMNYFMKEKNNSKACGSKALSDKGRVYFKATIKRLHWRPGNHIAKLLGWNTALLHTRKWPQACRTPHRSMGNATSQTTELGSYIAWRPLITDWPDHR